MTCFFVDLKYLLYRYFLSNMIGQFFLIVVFSSILSFTLDFGYCFCMGNNETQTPDVGLLRL